MAEPLPEKEEPASNTGKAPTLFRRMSDDHPHHVAMWFGEVFGGP